MKASSILVVLQLRYASDLPERLVKTFLGSPPESVSIGLGWHTKICISIKVPREECYNKIVGLYTSSPYCD